MNLFDTGPDPNIRGKKSAFQSTYDFFSENSRPEIVSMRNLVEGMFQRFPDCQRKASLKTDIQSSKEGFDDCFFELALHEILTGLGCSVEPEPDFGSKPDFRVTTPSGGTFYVEAVHSTGESRRDVALRRMEDQIHEHIQKNLVSLDFSWIMTVRSPSTQNPVLNRIVRNLQQATNRLEWIPPKEDTHLEPVIIEDNGWVLSFEPFPRTSEGRGVTGIKPIQIRATTGMVSVTAAQVREEIRIKRRQHRTLDGPLVVAVNAGQWDIDEEDFFDALYGDLQFTARMGASDVEPTRALNGIWRDKNGPKHGHMPYVLASRRMSPAYIHKSDLTIFPNPWIPVDETIQVPRIARWRRAEGGRLEKEVGIDLGELLGLQTDWPWESEED